MKPEIHPEYRQVVFQDQSSGDNIIVGSTMKTSETITLDGVEYPLAKVELSSRSHPFFTGQMKIVDTAGRVERFERRYGSRKKKKGAAAEDAPAEDAAPAKVEEAPVDKSDPSKRDKTPARESAKAEDAPAEEAAPVEEAAAEAPAEEAAAPAEQAAAEAPAEEAAPVEEAADAAEATDS